MHTSKGFVEEVYLDERRAARISCQVGLIPAPGRYLLAHAINSDSPLAHPVYQTGLHASGFFAASPLPSTWLPGVELSLNGPFGRGFNLPVSSRFVALAAFGGNCARLLALLEPALAQNAAIVLLTDNPPDNLPNAIEISPLSTLPDVTKWADYFALDAPRIMLPKLSDLLRPLSYNGYAQAFIETPLPCAGIGDCGVCAVNTRKGYKLACKDGPVFDLKMVLE